MAINEKAGDEEAGSVVVTPLALDRMGVAELERYIAVLQVEIDRARTQIAAKTNHRSAADELFKFS